MIKINIISSNKNWSRYINNPQNFFKIKISKFNKKFKKYKKKIVFFTLLLSNDTEIKNLNKKFRKKNKSTDVLSFPFYNKKELVRKLTKEKEIYLGDVIVNLNKIKERRDKSLFLLELDRLWIHGLVHLLGYDHKKFKDFNNMAKVEKKFMSYLN